MKAGDPFEAGRPERGVALRVRTWWRATHLAALIEPLVEWVRLTLDGAELSVEPVLVQNEQGKLIDAYYRSEPLNVDAARRLAAGTNGRCIAEATVREIRTRIESVVRCAFDTNSGELPVV